MFLCNKSLCDKTTTTTTTTLSQATVEPQLTVKLMSWKGKTLLASML